MNLQAPLKKFKNKKDILLGKKNAVELYHWSPPQFCGDGGNFGDYLSKIIVERVALSKNIDIYSKLKRHKLFSDSHQLLAIGSVLHFAKEGATVWGSGINGKKINYKFQLPNLDVRMVRGPLTRKVLLENGIECPEIYGDPAIILSDFFKFDVGKKKYKYIIIPNLNEISLYQTHKNVVSPLLPWEEIVKKILQSELVISSSLHGIVVADSYGVPARHLLSYSEPVFKYIDYYEGTGRSDYKFAQTLEEALSLGGEKKPQISKNKIYDSFPTDIW